MHQLNNTFKLKFSHHISNILTMNHQLRALFNMYQHNLSGLTITNNQLLISTGMINPLIPSFKKKNHLQQSNISNSMYLLNNLFNMFLKKLFGTTITMNHLSNFTTSMKNLKPTSKKLNHHHMLITSSKLLMFSVKIKSKDNPNLFLINQLEFNGLTTTNNQLLIFMNSMKPHNNLLLMLNQPQDSNTISGVNQLKIMLNTNQFFLNGLTIMNNQLLISTSTTIKLNNMFLMNNHHHINNTSTSKSLLPLSLLTNQLKQSGLTTTKFPKLIFINLMMLLTPM